MLGVKALSSQYSRGISRVEDIAASLQHPKRSASLNEPVALSILTWVLYHIVVSKERYGTGFNDSVTSI